MHGKEQESTISKQYIPTVAVGPIVRRVTRHTCNIWLVTTQPDTLSLRLTQHGQPLKNDFECSSVQIGSHAYIHLLTSTYEAGFDANVPVYYQIEFNQQELNEKWTHELTALFYKNQSSLSFCWTNKPQKILHGSCRKPHYPGDDALAQVDNLIEEAISNQARRPDILLMTGDQIYADDVAGPMLQAIHTIIEVLGLYNEQIDGSVIQNTTELATHTHSFYEREQLLPKIATNSALSKLFFGAKKKPVFTSVNAKNHLISSAEVLAMYLLVWSPSLWKNVSFCPEAIPSQHREKFNQECIALESFISQLSKVRRALAHIPVYMIFDDHDVTDDWNLTRGWEQEVYANPFSKRMIGNALIGYLLCQGWGNAPDKVAPLIAQSKKTFSNSGISNQDELIDALLKFEHWSYRLDTSPPIEVLDTRTRRWRSESNLNKPSGLMDWEALCEFQHTIIGKKMVIVVSPAPIYGVKFIEAIQKIFTFFGKALTVDAENWMAHKGTANVILNIFRHYKTPPEFIILSGDVHYSFVYDVRLRFRRNSPHITQFTCSGLKNAFPDGLLHWLDRLNRVFYGPKSILNIFTRRRNMSVTARAPSVGNRDLLNGCAIGILQISENSTVIDCKALLSSGKEVEFPPVKDN